MVSSAEMLTKQISPSQAPVETGVQLSGLISVWQVLSLNTKISRLWKPHVRLLLAKDPSSQFVQPSHC